MSQNNNAVAVAGQIKASLVALTPDFKAALPPHVPVERFIRVAQTAILNNPDILKCERNSIYSACLKAAQDGLLPDGKEAALVSFKGVATYMPMVQGILKTIRNSGQLGSIHPDIAYEKDDFRYWVDGDGPHLTHEPNFKEADRGMPVAFYCVAKTKDGERYIEVMTLGQIEDVMNSSRSKDSGPWAGAFKDEMAKKTVIRRLSKRLPKSTDVEEILSRDDQFYDFKGEDTPPPKGNGQPNRLNNLMKDKVQTQAPDSKPDITVEPTPQPEPAKKVQPKEDDVPI